MKAFDVRFEVPARSKGHKPRVNSRRVTASSADRAAERVAEDHNTRVNCRNFWVHSVRELPPGDERAA